jgi:hypothetical protein
MTARVLRLLYPWELRCGCPKCRVKPGERCVTTSTRYPLGYRFRDGTPALGRPTVAHKARYQLWCYLWCREKCETRPRVSKPKIKLIDNWDPVSGGRLVDGHVRCPKCGGRVVYNGNYFCQWWTFTKSGRPLREGECTWALPHPATSDEDRAICDALGIDYG